MLFLNDARNALKDVVLPYVRSVTNEGSTTRPWENDIRKYTQQTNITVENDVRVILTDIVKNAPLTPDTTLTYEEYHLALISLRHIALDAIYVTAENEKDMMKMTSSLNAARRELDATSKDSASSHDMKYIEAIRAQTLLQQEVQDLQTQVRCLSTEVERLNQARQTTTTTASNSVVTIEAYLMGLRYAVRSFAQWLQDSYLKHVEDVLGTLVPAAKCNVAMENAEDPVTLLDSCKQVLEITAHKLQSIPDVFETNKEQHALESRLLDLLMFDAQVLHGFSDNTLALMRKVIVEELEAHQESKWLDELVRTMPKATEYICATQSVVVERMHTRVFRWVEETQQRIKLRMQALKDVKGKQLGLLARTVTGTVDSIKGELRSDTISWKSQSVSATPQQQQLQQQQQGGDHQHRGNSPTSLPPQPPGGGGGPTSPTAKRSPPLSPSATKQRPHTAGGGDASTELLDHLRNRGRGERSTRVKHPSSQTPTTSSVKPRGLHKLYPLQVSALEGAQSPQFTFQGFHFRPIRSSTPKTTLHVKK